MRTWANVARLTKVISQGKGFAAKPAADLPFLLSEGIQVFFVPPQIDMPRQAYVQSTRELDGIEHEIIFEGLQDFETNMNLVGSYCLVCIDDIDKDMLDSSSALLEGFFVYDKAIGYLGSVASIEGNELQSLLVVQRAVEDRPLLIPFVDEFIDDIDWNEAQIHVSIPVGLLEL